MWHGCEADMVKSPSVEIFLIPLSSTVVFEQKL